MNVGRISLNTLENGFRKFLEAQGIINDFATAKITLLRHLRPGSHSLTGQSLPSIEHRCWFLEELEVGSPTIWNVDNVWTMWKDRWPLQYRANSENEKSEPQQSYSFQLSLFMCFLFFWQNGPAQRGAFQRERNPASRDVLCKLENENEKKVQNY